MSATFSKMATIIGSRAGSVFRPGVLIRRRRDRRERPEQAVVLALDAGREKQRARGTGRGAVAEVQRPKPVDAQPRPGRRAELPPMDRPFVVVVAAGGE